MKKLFIALTALFCLSTGNTVFAQDKEALKAEKAAIKEAEKTLKDAKKLYDGNKRDPQVGRNEPNYEKMQPAMALVDQAMENKYTNENPLTYKTAADVYYVFLLKDFGAIKNEPDNKQLVKNCNTYAQKVLAAACKFDVLAPNDPKTKPEVLKFQHAEYQKMASDALLISFQYAQQTGQNIDKTATPEELREAVNISKLVNKCLETEPLFSDFKHDQLEDIKTYAKVFAAQPLLDMPDASADEIESAFSQLFTTKHAESAYLQLAAYFNKKDPAKYKEYLKKGHEAFPENEQLAVNLFNSYTISKDYDAAYALAMQIIEKSPERAGDMWKYVGSNFYNQEKYQDALDAFQKSYDASQNDDCLKNVAVCANQLVARDNGKDKAVTKALYDKCIDAFEKYQAASPDDSEFWGPVLYRCYNNIGNNAKAAEYKKYYK